MPIIRYFVFVGGLLLALLFAADRYLPVPWRQLPRRIPTGRSFGSPQHDAFLRRLFSTRVRPLICR